MSKVKSKVEIALYEAFLKLETMEECYNFFQDICTYKEIEAMSNRLEAAKLLEEGKTYEEILKDIKISSTTLSRVSKALKYGDGGYKLIIDRSKENK